MLVLALTVKKNIKDEGNVFLKIMTGWISMTDLTSLLRYRPFKI